MSQRPSQFSDWATTNPSNVVQPSASQIQTGYLPNQPLPAELLNWQFQNIGQFLRYFDGVSAANTTLSTVEPSIRLIGGGTWSFSLATGTLSWSDTAYFAYPGLPDASSSLPSGSVTIAPGAVAYVTANAPLVQRCTVTSGSKSLGDVASASDVQVGWQASGAGIPSGATVTAIDGAAGTVTLSAAATSTASNVPVSFAGSGVLTAQSSPMSSYVATANGVIFARATDNAVLVGVGTGQMHVADGEQKRLLRQGYGTTFMLTAGVGLTRGQAVYVSTGADGRTAGSLYPCDASAANGATRAKCQGVVYQTTAAGSPARVVSSGVLPLSGLTPGATYYLDPATPGALTATRPGGLLQYVVPVGQALSSASLLLPGSVPQAPRTLDSMLDHVTVQLGGTRFSSGYTAGAIQAVVQLVPSGSSAVAAAIYQTFDRYPYVTRFDCSTDAKPTGGTMSLSLQYQYDGTVLSGPYGSAGNGIATTATLVSHGFSTFAQTYAYDMRPNNFQLDPFTAYLGVASFSANQSTTVNCTYSMTLGYLP